MTRHLHADIGLRLDPEFTILTLLEVPAGTTTALVGPNGSGKSTVVSILAGLRGVGTGHISVGDRVLDDPSTGTFVAPEHRRIGVVFQDGLLFPHLTVRDNVAFGAAGRGHRNDGGSATVDEWVHRLGLDEFADRKPPDLSGGERQRVAIARAIAMNPDVLVLDEPLSAVDVSAKPALRWMIADFLSEFAGPAVIVTHDPAEAALLADELVVMERGSVTQVGTMDEIAMKPASPYVADLVGVNFFRASAKAGEIRTAGHVLQSADVRADGPVLVTIHPRSVSLHARRPEGSARNVWSTPVVRVEATGETVRIATGAPLALTVEVTRDGAAEVGAEVGKQVWVSIKATEVRVDRTSAASAG